VRRLVIGNVVLAVMLVAIILISGINTEAAIASTPSATTPQVLVAGASTTKTDTYTITGYPNSVNAGQSFSGITVTVYNTQGNIAIGYKGTVYFTSIDPKATLPYTSQKPYTFTTGSKGDKGVHTFSGFNLVTAGSQTITVTDGKISASTSAIAVNPASPIQIAIAPKTATVTAGGKQAYTATATDYYGNSWNITSLTSWSIDIGAGGSWSGTTYTSARRGIWTVTGAYLGFHDSASLTVNHATANGITVSPKNPTVTAGSSVTFTTSAFDSFGNFWDVTSLTSWSLGSGAGGSWIGNVYDSAKSGVWTVTGTFGSYSDTASLNVTPASPISLVISPKNPNVAAGSSIAFSATATDGFGNSWDVTNHTVWVINPGAKGNWSANVYTSAKVGIWTVTGINGGLSDQASLTVGYCLTFSITISPKNSTLAAGSSEAFAATASDIYGNSWDVTNSTTWSIDVGAGGSWSNNTYNAALAGTWAVIGTYKGMSDTASLSVTHGSPSNIVISSNLTSATAGSTVVYTATATDGFGNSWDATGSAVWFVDSGAGGSWSGNVYTCVVAGSWRVTGFLGGLTNTASLTVTPASPVSITLSPKTASLTAGFSQTYIATATDARA